MTLPNGTKADHADGIQVANGQGGIISGNDLSIGNGTWYQAINVHHEADSPYKSQEVSPVTIKGNTIENNHDFAINAQHYGVIDVERDKNTIAYTVIKNRNSEEDMGIRKVTLEGKKGNEK